MTRRLMISSSTMRICSLMGRPLSCVAAPVKSMRQEIHRLGQRALGRGVEPLGLGLEFAQHRLERAGEPGHLGKPAMAELAVSECTRV